LDPNIRQALEQMMTQQEPFPLVVVGGDFTILRANHGAQALFGTFIAEPACMPKSPDLFTLLFHPQLLRPFVHDWPGLARRLLGRLQREVLQRGDDDRLQALLERIMAFPDVPLAWRHPDFSTEAPAAQTLRLTRDRIRVGFLVAITKLSAPQQVLLDELSIESCFPLDEATRETCKRLALT
jgi:hypothetical protein